MQDIAPALRPSTEDASRRPSITAIILTRDEEVHIARCIASARQVAQHIVVVDSFSSDGTVSIARQLGAEVHQRAFTNQAAQMQWALDTFAIGTDWILRLDADEYLEPALVREIQERAPSLPTDISGVFLRRKLIFRGRRIRFGGYYPTVLLRLWRTGRAQIPHTWMDEHTVLTEGQSVTFAHDFRDHDLKDITAWTEKHNRYATRKMIDLIAAEHGLRPTDTGIPSGALKSKLRTTYRAMPLYLRPTLYFAYRYIIRLGFLDGANGFVWHALQGFWYHLLIDAKVSEARAFIRAHGLDAFKAHIKDRHGITL